MNKHYPYRPDMPVSAKYYARLCERVRTILNDCLFSEQACANRERRILYLINRYMCPKAGLVCPQGDDPICNIIFQTLRAEIDAAMERSRRARQSAALRRAARLASAAASTAAIAIPPAAPSGKPASAPTAATPDAHIPPSVRPRSHTHATTAASGESIG